MFQAKISNEEVALLPVENFQGKIVVITTVPEMKSAIEKLKKEKVVGFDTETKPSFVKNESNKIALMQVATEDTAYLFRINILRKQEDYEEAIFEAVSNDSVLKIGLSLKDDFFVAKKSYNFKPLNFIDLQHVVKDYGIEELSLKKIYAILFAKKLSKRMRTSNWEADFLRDAQLNYAALDAWTCLKIWQKLREN
jgi:ribonuclease D